MTDKTKLKKKQTMTRQEAAAWLSTLAQTLTAGGAGEVDVAGEKVAVQVADQIRAEIEVEARAGEYEVEIELSWASTSAAGTADEPPPSAPPE